MSVTGHSDVDMESASAFSPSEPSIDGVFVSKHNQSAEIYQIFKEDVDALLSGRTPQHEQPGLIQRILHTCENMYVVFEDEKQHLMGDVLLSWAMKQQRGQVEIVNDGNDNASFVSKREGNITLSNLRFYDSQGEHRDTVDAAAPLQTTRCDSSSVRLN
ncbi:unnamed protein product [Strongylus vulgaris]|uniref:Signal transducer and activator of transcription b N-terminal domain-containing protein n=1 Tax=Strongylus vulgaris TaxID=40348 RepID=A0A3P7IGU9_STRVU|nr:unnamed protein product [Strongylus vulgaris]